MSRKLTHEAAAQIMRAAKLEPITEYPGNKLSWKCICLVCGLEVSPSLSSVRNNGGGCRKCGIKKSANLRKINEKEAIDYMKSSGAIPLEPYQGSKYPWLCRCINCKREIRPAYGNVKNNGTHPCAYCSKKKVHPDDAVKLMRDAGLEPLTPFPGSNIKWQCRHTKCGQIVFTKHSWIVSGQGGCKTCGYKEGGLKGQVPSENAIGMMKKAGLTPLVPYPGSGRPWQSKCSKCAQITSPTFNSIKSGSGCGVCGGKIVPEALAVRVMLNANLKPLTPYPGSKTKWKCECLRCKKIVFPKYGDVNQGDGGCKYCGGHFVEPDAAVALMLSANIKPLEPYKDSGTRWKSECLVCKKIIQPTYNGVQQRGSGCKYCAKKFIDPDDAISAMVAAKLEPLVPYPGSQKPWLCKCLRCGREVQPAYTSVQSGLKGCVYCGGKKVDPNEAFRMMLSSGLTPLEAYQRADKPWKCTCNKCKKLVTPTYTSIRIGQGGCKYCTNKGLDYNEPGYLYLMTNESFGAHKVGVANDKTRINRVKEHQKSGWTLYKTLSFKTGEDAFAIEQQVLLWFRVKLGLGVYLNKDLMPQGGYSETVDAAEIDLATIWAKVEDLSKVKA